MRTHFSPLTLVVVAIFSMIKIGRRLRLTAIKARVTVFLFVPPSGRFFCPENGRGAAGVRYRVPEAQGRGRDIEGEFRGSHPGQTSLMAEKNPETWPAEPGRKVRQ
ncbi:hypothetical protein [Pantoea agglomerans]|uniref:hypothetical protein n=1 Tax=Enterobacter agglomerans TaxID=549 RepID=UPI00045C6949|nr:hypothetical protein [Pantoea agglomerans]KDA94306.1 hypothetical protein T296_11565 [Pantoea agglomerans Eh318]